MDDLGDAGVEGVGHGVHVVGDAAHHFAVGILVEEVDGQLVDLDDDGVAQVIGDLVGDVGQGEALGVGEEHAQYVQPQQDQDDLAHIVEVHAVGAAGGDRRHAAHDLVGDPRQDLGVDGAQQGGADRADGHQQDQPFVHHHVLYELLHAGLEVLGLFAAAPHARRASAAGAAPPLVLHFAGVGAHQGPVAGRIGVQVGLIDLVGVGELGHQELHDALGLGHAFGEFALFDHFFYLFGVEVLRRLEAAGTLLPAGLARHLGGVEILGHFARIEVFGHFGGVKPLGHLARIEVLGHLGGVKALHRLLGIGREGVFLFFAHANSSFESWLSAISR